MKQKLFYLKLFFLMLLPGAIIAQTTITGKISSNNGESLAFVNVLEKGTINGTTTDNDGNFSIAVNSLPTTLEFSSLGFAPLEQVVSSNTPLRITLQESTEALEEVVITGLGTSIKRSNAANAVASVSAEELVGTTSQSTVDGALYGKVAGVNITSSSGAPGGGFALRLRGVSSINGNNQPLIIVDGVYFNNVEIPSGLRFASGANRGNEENAGNRMADLDPNDIEDIEILKGSSAAAIYGQRGNAGVIIITTKRGQQGKTKISFRQDVGINKIATPLGLRPWTAESVFNSFYSPSDDPARDAASRAAAQAEVAKYNATIAERGSLYDLEDIIYGETGFITETAISATGGSDKTKFYIGGSYREEDGIIKNTGFDRFSIRTNIEHKLSNTFDIVSTTNYTRSESSRSFTGNENEGGLSYGYTLAFTRPWNNFFPDENGNYPNNPNAAGNPIFVRDQARNEDTNNRLIQSLSLNTKIYNDDRNRLKLLMSAGVDYLANETFVYVPETHQAQVGGQNGFVSVGKNNFTQFNNQAILVWNHDALDGDLALTTQAGVTYLIQDQNLANSRGSGLAAGQTNVSQSVNQEVEQFLRQEKDFGMFAQVEGNYKDQFIATLGYRRDKSTRNGDANEFYGFPKASLAVNLTNFEFWSSETVNQLKLRAAYGETGNPANFGSTFTSLNTSNVGGLLGQSIQGLRGDSAVNPETSQEFEVGFDLGMFDNRLTLEATYYKKTVDDLILTRALETSSGFSVETTNLGELENQGIELSLNTAVIQNENFSWNSGVQFFLNRSEVTRLDVPAFAQPGAGFGLGLGTFYIEEGSPVTQLVGNLDLDGDGTPTPTRVGDVEPDFQMSFNNSFTFFKNFEASFLLHWREGSDNLNLSTFLSDLGQTTYDLETAEGQARLGTPANALRFVENASYLRLREAALYYNLPSNTVKSVFGELVQSVKLGASGRNLFTISPYSSYDPETSVNGGTGLSSGIEVAPFPSARQVYFHLYLNF